MVITIRLTPCPATRWLIAVDDFLQARRRWSKPAAQYPGARSLSVVTVGLVCCATFTADASVPLVKPTPGLASKPDPRVVRLGKLFRTYHCPEPHHIPEYLSAADGYGLDYRLLPAVSIRETLCGTMEKQNNRWGYHPGRQTFPSIEAGIDFMARQLAENPLYKGKTLQEKLYTYNPLSAYPGEVERIMRRAD
jgi:hypothetical protein